MNRIVGISRPTPLLIEIKDINTLNERYNRLVDTVFKFVQSFKAFDEIQKTNPNYKKTNYIDETQIKELQVIIEIFPKIFANLHMYIDKMYKLLETKGYIKIEGMNEVDIESYKILFVFGFTIGYFFKNASTLVNNQTKAWLAYLFKDLFTNNCNRFGGIMKEKCMLATSINELITNNGYDIPIGDNEIKDIIYDFIRIGANIVMNHNNKYNYGNANLLNSNIVSKLNEYLGLQIGQHI